jgi:hypothetical protein
VGRCRGGPWRRGGPIWGTLEVGVSPGEVHDSGGGLEMCTGCDGSDKRSRCSSTWSVRSPGSPWCTQWTRRSWPRPVARCQCEGAPCREARQWWFKPTVEAAGGEVGEYRGTRAVLEAAEDGACRRVASMALCDGVARLGDGACSGQ